MFAIRTLPVILFLNYFARHCAARNFRIESYIQKQQQVTDDIPACQIYCEGPLLHTVQMSNIYQDSKTFVDMKLRHHPNQTMAAYLVLMESANDNPSQKDIRDFVHDYFDDFGKEFMPWRPEDWKPNPKFLDQIRDPDLKQWGLDLNALWKDLGRKMIEDVQLNSDFYSIIPVPHPVIVPGGRFREFYYWDSYWIVRGLLYSEMYTTALGMLENFLSIVRRFGYIPNGGRIYYKRSQPPLLSGMMKAYAEFTKDDTFIINSLDVLEHEFEFWMNNHTVQAKGYNMCVYGDSSVGPRPEAYREDVENSEVFKTDAEKEGYYAELRAAAESGMDFSSRWFIDNKGTNGGNLTNSKTRSIVPVELNAILYWNAKIIAEYHLKAKNNAKSAEYEAKAAKIFEAIEKVLWNEEVGAWLDYDIINNKPRNYFVPTNLSPLWLKAYDQSKAQHISDLVLRYIERNGLDSYPGGVPNTLNKTGEQWDFPNVWAPMQYIMVEGLENLGTPAAVNLSQKWGHRWVKSNFKAYRETHIMFEKYDAERFGGHGGGGEYDIQKGFGWSNGIIVEYLTKYGHQISIATSSTGEVME